MNYPDQVVCLFASGVIVAALLERDRTGQGAHLDLSQRELTSFLMGEELIAAAAGVPSPRRGNADPADPAERCWPTAMAGARARAAARRCATARAGGLGRFPRRHRGAASPDGPRPRASPIASPPRPLTVRAAPALGEDNRAVLSERPAGAEEIDRWSGTGCSPTRPRFRRGAPVARSAPHTRKPE